MTSQHLYGDGSLQIPGNTRTRFNSLRRRSEIDQVASVPMSTETNTFRNSELVIAYSSLSGGSNPPRISISDEEDISAILIEQPILDESHRKSVLRKSRPVSSESTTKTNFNSSHRERYQSSADWVKHPICTHCGSITPRSGVTTVYGTPTMSRSFMNEKVHAFNISVMILTL